MLSAAGHLSRLRCTAFGNRIIAIARLHQQALAVHCKRNFAVTHIAGRTIGRVAYGADHPASCLHRLAKPVHCRYNCLPAGAGAEGNFRGVQGLSLNVRGKRSHPVTARHRDQNGSGMPDLCPGAILVPETCVSPHAQSPACCARSGSCRRAILQPGTGRLVW